MEGFPGIQPQDKTNVDDRFQVLAAVDPFTYAVHAFKNLLLKNTGFEAITNDLVYLGIFSVVAMTAATRLFRRTL